MGQDGNIVQFKIKKHTALKKLMSTYCERAGLALQVALLAKSVFFNFQKYGWYSEFSYDHQTIRFSFDGTRINEGDTPKGLDMEVDFCKT